MFDMLSGMMAAFSQAMMLLGGLVFSTVGLTILGNTLYWKLRAERVEATVLGVRRKQSKMNGSQDIYYPVYSYSFTDGTMIETTSRGGSNMTDGKDTGRKTTLLVFRSDPHNVREAGGMTGVFFGILFFLPGPWLLYSALTDYPLTGYTAAMIAAFFLYGALKTRRFLIPKAQRKSAFAWKADRRAARQSEWDARPIERIEDITASAGYRSGMAAQRKNYKFMIPLCLLLACALGWGAVHTGKGIHELETKGLHAGGKVIDLHEERDSDGSVYYPIVQYQTAQGDYITFRDRHGSYPASHSMGEEVEVLYLENDPEHDVLIDRGAMNWLLPGICGGFGILLILAAFGMMRALRSDEAL